MVEINLTGHLVLAFNFLVEPFVYTPYCLGNSIVLLA